MGAVVGGVGEEEGVREEFIVEVSLWVLVVGACFSLSAFLAPGILGSW